VRCGASPSQTWLSPPASFHFVSVASPSVLFVFFPAEGRRLLKLLGVQGRLFCPDLYVPAGSTGTRGHHLCRCPRGPLVPALVSFFANISFQPLESVWVFVFFVRGYSRGRFSGKPLCVFLDFLPFQRAASMPSQCLSSHLSLLKTCRGCFPMFVTSCIRQIPLGSQFSA